MVDDARCRWLLSFSQAVDVGKFGDRDEKLKHSLVYSMDDRK